MKLVSLDYNIDFSIDEGDVFELVIENQAVFSSIIFSLYSQCNGKEGAFVLSDKKGILKTEKYMDIISDYYLLSVNNKKIINRLYSKLEETALDYIEEKAEINSKIVSLLDRLTTSLGYVDVEYAVDFKWTDLYKIYCVEFDEIYDSLLEKLSSYIKIISTLSDIRILFFVNLKSYLEPVEIQQLFDIASYCKINLFLLESKEEDERSVEKRYIIDKDKCLIDAN